MTLALDVSHHSKCESVWLNINKLSEEFDIEKPNLPRIQKLPKRIDNSNIINHVFWTAEVYYRNVYYEVFDQVI